MTTKLQKGRKIQFRKNSLRQDFPQFHQRDEFSERLRRKPLGQNRVRWSIPFEDAMRRQPATQLELDSSTAHLIRRYRKYKEAA